MRKCAENGKLCDPAPTAPNMCPCFILVKFQNENDVADLKDLLHSSMQSIVLLDDLVTKLTGKVADLTISFADTKADMRNLKTSVEEDRANLKTSVKEDMADLKTSVGEDMADLKTSVEEDLKATPSGGDDSEWGGRSR